MNFITGYTQMSKPGKFILSSDYATLANDSDTEIITINIPAVSLGAGATTTYSGTVVVGTAGAPIETDINYSLTSHRWVGNFLFVVESTYFVNILVYRDSPVTAKAIAVVFNYTGGSTTLNARTITVRVRSFVPPFS